METREVLGEEKGMKGPEWAYADGEEVQVGSHSLLYLTIGGPFRVRL